MMRYVTVLALLIMLPLSQVQAQEIPEWVKITAGWWADEAITDADFISGIQYLIREGIILVPATTSSENQDTIPEWVKITAGWWAGDKISDDEFTAAINHLIKIGVITIDADDTISDMQAELKKCQKFTKIYERFDCENMIEEKIKIYQYKHNSQIYQVGPITFYYPGIGAEGNEFFMEGEQPIFTIRILAENSESSENVTLSCTGPSICSYDLWDGTKSYKYSGTDFTNGQIVLKPGDAREFNMLFGPNIGYGGTQFEYDFAKQYTFRISEPWGSAQIPIVIK